MATIFLPGGGQNVIHISWSATSNTTCARVCPGPFLLAFVIFWYVFVCLQMEEIICWLADAYMYVCIHVCMYMCYWNTASVPSKIHAVIYFLHQSLRTWVNYVNTFASYTMLAGIHIRAHGTAPSDVVLCSDFTRAFFRAFMPKNALETCAEKLPWHRTGCLYWNCRKLTHSTSQTNSWPSYLRIGAHALIPATFQFHKWDAY